jgi:hypothetical protein
MGGHVAHVGGINGKKLSGNLKGSDHSEQLRVDGKNGVGKCGPDVSGSG